MKLSKKKRELHNNKNNLYTPKLWTGVEISSILNGCLVHVIALAFNLKAKSMQKYLKGYALSGYDLQAENLVSSIHEAEGLKPAPAKSAGGGVQNIPQPPPMTREMLYKSVFNNCDEDNKGYVSVKNLIYSSFILLNTFHLLFYFLYIFTLWILITT